jgi:ribosomal protein L29
MKSAVFLHGWTIVIACCMNPAGNASDLLTTHNPAATNPQAINLPRADRGSAVDDKSVNFTEQIRELRASLLAMKQKFEAETKQKDTEIATLKREIAEMKVKLAGLPTNASGSLPSLARELAQKAAIGTNAVARPASPRNLRVVGN